MLNSTHRQRIERSVQRDEPPCYRWDHVLPGGCNYVQRSVTANEQELPPDPCPRYQLQVPHLDEWFPPVADMATVSVTDLWDGSTFHRQVPAVYLFHLHWIIHESSGSGELGLKEGVRPAWLREVLDRFSEEIRAMKDLSDWRSIVLNPVLVRAMHQADDLDERSITRKVKADARTTRKKMTLKDWEGFYLNLDVVQPIHKWWWLEAKSIEPKCPSDIPAMQGVGSARGVLLSVWYSLRLTVLIIVDPVLPQSVVALSGGHDSPPQAQYPAHLEDPVDIPSMARTDSEGHTVLTSDCGTGTLRCTEIHEGIAQPPERPMVSDRDADPTAEQEVVAAPADLNLDLSANVSEFWLGDTNMDIYWHDGCCEASHSGTLTPPIDREIPFGWYSKPADWLLFK